MSLNHLHHGVLLSKEEFSLKYLQSHTHTQRCYSTLSTDHRFLVRLCVSDLGNSPLISRGSCLSWTTRLCYWLFVFKLYLFEKLVCSKTNCWNESVCLSICLCLCVYSYLYVFLFVSIPCLSVRLPVFLFVFVSLLSVFLFTHEYD